MSKVGVCLIVKNEAPYLVEWIAHYVALGFDEISIYDNESTDQTPDIVRSIAAREARVRYIHWPNVDGRVPQQSAYEDAISRSSSEWLGFFDADELLVLQQHGCIQEFLERYPPQAGAVAINWLLFGSAGHVNPARDLQAVRFRRCAKDGPGTKNCFVKSLVKTDAVETVAAHTSQLKPGYVYYNDCAEPAEFLTAARTTAPSRMFAQLNHYVVRSRAEFEQKRARGRVDRTSASAEKFNSRDEAFFRSHDRNEARDLSISPWIGRAAGIRGMLRRYLDHDGLNEYE